MLDRFAICEVYLLLEIYYNVGGVLWERRSNVRRKMSTDYQLDRMQFKSRSNLDYATLSDEQVILFHELISEWGLPDFEIE